MADPAGSGDLGDLRQLLIGPELEQLAILNDRVADPVKRTADLAEALPGAIRSAKSKPLRDALEPVFEKAFSSSVRKNPRELADAIYPIIGPAIRSSISAAIRDFAEALNQIVEKSVSLRSIRWRIESIITGKPFSEILMARSLLYSVEQVFLIHRKSGLLLLHVAAQGSVLKDADMISGMLTAIQDFMSDSFTEGGQDLETVDAGRFKLWLTYSPKILMVGAVGGTAPVELRKVFCKALDEVEEQLQSEIDHFRQDDVSVFEPARPLLEKCLLGQSAPDKTKKARLWPFVAALGLVAVGLVGFWFYTQDRWNRYFEALKQQPGVVVTGVERHGFSYSVAGLKDPQAPDPLDLLRAQKLKPERIHYSWQPYLSLNTPFAAKRDLDDATSRITRQVIRFDTNSSKLPMAEADRIEELATLVQRVAQLHSGAKVTVTGHADETGMPGVNEKLSTERANQVADALVALGVARSLLNIVGAGNANPLRAGTTEWDRATNRGVSFQVALP